MGGLGGAGFERFGIDFKTNLYTLIVIGQKQTLVFGVTKYNIN